MEIVERTIGDVTVLDLKGKMTLGEGDQLYRDKILLLLDAGKTKLLINLDGVSYMDSAGLGEFVRTHTTVSRRGGRMKIAQLTKRIDDLLDITKLKPVFEIFGTEAEGLKSFEKEPAS
jgi:anti-sigma B factor antagonist